MDSEPSLPMTMPVASRDRPAIVNEKALTVPLMLPSLSTVMLPVALALEPGIVIATVPESVIL